MSAYKIFTINGGRVEEGATVGEFTLTNGTKIPAIIIGEEGRGRSLGVLPVSGGAQPGDKIMAVEIAQSRSGRPKLIARSEPSSDEKVIVVMKTKIGFRGGNAHTGDRLQKVAAQATCGHGDFLPWPGEEIVTGTIAQGGAGRMGSGGQKVSMISKGVVFRTRYSGRLYGGPNAHYYTFDGSTVQALTWDERLMVDEW